MLIMASTAQHAQRDSLIPLSYDSTIEKMQAMGWVKGGSPFPFISIY